MLGSRHLGAIALFAITTFAWANAHAVQAGVAAGVKGRATIEGNDRPEPKVIRSGESILTNDTLVTGVGSRMQALLVDETALTLGPNSSLTIDRFVYDPNKGSGEMVANMLRGSLRFVSGRSAALSRPQFKIKTPVGVMGIRGTSSIIVERDGGKSFFMGLVGPGPENNAGLAPAKIEFSNEYGSQTVDKAGVGFFVELNQPPGALVPVPEDISVLFVNKAPEVADQPADGAEGEQKEGEQKEGEQKEGEQKEGEQKEGEQKEGEQQEGEQQEGEQQEGEQQEGEQQEGEQQEGGQQEGEQQEGEQQEGGQQEGEQQEGGQQESEQQESGQQEGEQQEGEQPQGEQPQGEQPQGEQPQGEQPQGETQLAGNGDGSPGGQDAASAQDGGSDNTVAGNDAGVPNEADANNIVTNDSPVGDGGVIQDPVGQEDTVANSGIGDAAGDPVAPDPQLALAPDTGGDPVAPDPQLALAPDAGGGLLAPDTQIQIDSTPDTDLGLLQNVDVEVAAGEPVNILLPNLTVIDPVDDGSQGQLAETVNEEVVITSQIQEIANRADISVGAFVEFDWKGSSLSGYDGFLLGEDGLVSGPFIVAAGIDDPKLVHPNISLDQDCVVSNCSEVIIIDSFASTGLYGIGMHLDSEINTPGDIASDSGNLFVRVNQGGTLVRTSNGGSEVTEGRIVFEASPPSTGLGDTWFAAQINPVDGQISNINQIEDFEGEKIQLTGFTGLTEITNKLQSIVNERVDISVGAFVEFDWKGSSLVDFDGFIFGEDDLAGRPFIVTNFTENTILSHPNISLDQDCVVSNCSEVIIIDSFASTGLYGIGMELEDEPASSSAIAADSANLFVRVNQGGTLVRTSNGGSEITGGTTVFEVSPPSTGAGNTWLAAQLDASTGNITAIDQIIDADVETIQIDGFPELTAIADRVTRIADGLDVSVGAFVEFDWKGSSLSGYDGFLLGEDGLVSGPFIVAAGIDDPKLVHPNISLDQDCVVSNCSEVIIIDSFASTGLYGIGMHLDSEINTPGDIASDSGNLFVRVNQGGTLVRTSNGGSEVSGGVTLFEASPPSTGLGDTWFAAQINPVDGQISNINQIEDFEGEKIQLTGFTGLTEITNKLQSIVNERVDISVGAFVEFDWKGSSLVDFDGFILGEDDLAGRPFIVSAGFNEEIISHPKISLDQDCVVSNCSEVIIIDSFASTGLYGIGMDLVGVASSPSDPVSVSDPTIDSGSLTDPSLVDSGSLVDPALSADSGSLTDPSLVDSGSLVDPALSADSGSLTDPSLVDSGSLVDPALSADSGSLTDPSLVDSGSLVDPALSADSGSLTDPSLVDSGSLVDPALGADSGSLAVSVSITDSPIAADSANLFVRVNQGGTLVRTSNGGSEITGGTTVFEVSPPSTGTGNTWLAAQLDASTGNITAIDQIIDVDVETIQIDGFPELTAIADRVTRIADGLDVSVGAFVEFDWKGSSLSGYDGFLLGVDESLGPFIVTAGIDDPELVHPNISLDQDCVVSNCSEVIIIDSFAGAGLHDIGMALLDEPASSLSIASDSGNLFVRVNQGGTLVRTSNGGSEVSGGVTLFEASPPSTGVGDTWVAAQIDGSTGSITPINQIIDLGFGAFIDDIKALANQIDVSVGAFVEFDWKGSSLVDFDGFIFGEDDQISGPFIVSALSESLHPKISLDQDCVVSNCSEVIIIDGFGSTGLYGIGMDLVGVASSPSDPVSVSESIADSPIAADSANLFVRVNQGGTLVRTSNGGSEITGGTTVFEVSPPSTGTGNTWLAAQLDASTGNITAIDQIIDADVETIQIDGFPDLTAIANQIAAIPPQVDFGQAFFVEFDWKGSSLVDFDGFVFGQDDPIDGPFLISASSPNSTHPFLRLDVDCISSQCSEVIAMTGFTSATPDGLYGFGMGQLEQSSVSTNIAGDSANLFVRVKQGGTLVRTANGGSEVTGGTTIFEVSPPSTGEGNIWLAGKINEATGEVSHINKILNLETPEAAFIDEPELAAVAGGILETQLQKTVSELSSELQSIQLSINQTLDATLRTFVEFNWDASTLGDLDAHLNGPDGNGGSFHVFSGSPESIFGAKLEGDCTGSCRSEVITIDELNAGDYRLSLFNVDATGDVSSTALTDNASSIVMKINQNGTLQRAANGGFRIINGTTINQISPSPSGPGNTWIAANINRQQFASEAEVSIVNQITTFTNGSAVTGFSSID